jgi:hypothetical protein
MNKYFLIFAGFLAFLPAGHDARAAEFPQNFQTPEVAVDALVAAVRTNDRESLLNILGDNEDSQAILYSGDKIQDDQSRDIFLSAYDIRHKVIIKEDVATLDVGAEDWPFPIPVVHTAEGWAFDTAAGRQTILYRRIGRNELSTIQVVLAYVDAQNDYASLMRKKNGQAFYAQHIISHSGKQDGLYWPTAKGEAESPMGDLMAEAATEGYTAGKGERKPYHGYYYKILTQQGPSAPGGAINYVANDKMIGGFALIAWPAEYGNSGVMTFIVNYTGTIYQKDLGENTDSIAQKTESFNPDETWKKLEEKETQL